MRGMICWIGLLCLVTVAATSAAEESETTTVLIAPSESAAPADAASDTSGSPPTVPGENASPTPETNVAPASVETAGNQGQSASTNTPATGESRPPANAAAMPTTSSEDENRFRLDLNMSLLGMAFRNNLDNEAAGVYWINAGPGGSIFGLGLGGFIKGHIGVGCRVTAGIGTRAGADLTSSYLTFEYQILPYFEYIFGSSKVKPFIQVNMGLGGYLDRFEADEGYKNVETELQYLFGFGGGAHFFFGERASFDLWLMDMVGIGKNKTTEELSSTSLSSGETSSGETESEYSILTNTLSLFIGVAIWI